MDVFHGQRLLAIVHYPVWTFYDVFNELQAVLLRVRDADEPDILFPFPTFSSDIIGIHHLLAANMLTGKTTPVEDEARLTAAVEKFVAD